MNLVKKISKEIYGWQHWQLQSADVFGSCSTTVAAVKSFVMVFGGVSS